MDKSGCGFGLEFMTESKLKEKKEIIEYEGF